MAIARSSRNPTTSQVTLSPRLPLKCKRSPIDKARSTPPISTIIPKTDVTRPITE